LKSAVDAKRQFSGESEMKIREFDSLLSQKIKIMEVDEDLVKRSVNEGFSGGEKKRNEILQMLLLDPKLALLDETDSGLDIDALKIVSNGVNTFRSSDKGVLMVTHYQRILDYVTPDFVHVLIDGQIALSGDNTLALELEKHGYDWVK
jgi:Fe-S cluster assembly ATP-binding protein